MSSAATADTATRSKIDDTINQNMIGGRAAGAAGLQQVAGEQAAIGSTELSNALSLLGISGTAANSIMNNALQSRAQDPNIGKTLGSLAGNLFSAWLLGGGGLPGGGGGAPGKISLPAGTTGWDQGG